MADNSDGANPNAQRLAELAALVDAVKERVRAQYPEGAGQPGTGGISVGLPDLAPLARARDAAAGKMASIGTVNPRAGGLVNNSIQALKRAVSRALNWFVRDQVVFNRQMIACVETCIETLADVNRTIHALAGQTNNHIQQLRAEADPLRAEAQTLRAKTSELQDIAAHWPRWREEWQLKLHRNEVEFLRSVADLNTAMQQKLMFLEASGQQRETRFHETARELEAGFGKLLNESIRTQHDDFERLTNSHAEAIQHSIEALDERQVTQAREFERQLATSLTNLQKQFYADLERIRAEYERTIHTELRLIRQRLASAPPPAPAARPASDDTPFPFDYARFAARFRGSEEYVTEAQRFYLPYFSGRRRVLDLGCGRGEFLKLMRDSGVPAKGIEASDESVAYCRAQGLEANRADLFSYLAEQAEASLDGIFCSQVVEHLSPERLPEMVRLCASRLATGGILVIETPNPECLAIFATHFYLDPTHTRPVPSQLLAFYLEEFGMGRIEVHRRAPAVESMPEVGQLPEGFREKFFGGLDYAILASKL